MLAPRVLRLTEWPDLDRQLWQAGLSPGDILDGGTYAQGLRRATVRNSTRGYGRWLAILAGLDPLALSLDPGARVTPARVRLFLKALQESGNTNNTIVARFWELRSALRIMLPDRDFSWLNKPGGQSLSALLPAVLKPGRIIDLRELARWGEELMDTGLQESLDARTEWFRNGLLVAILANRAPRQRSLASFRLGRTIVRRSERYYVSLGAEDTKTGQPLQYSLSESLTPRIDHYLEVERPRLLAGRVHDWFWVNRHGGRLGEMGVQQIIRRGSKARFGFAIGTHRFRHSLATTSMILDPTTPGVVAAVLGNSPFVVEHHYDLGRQIEAARRWHATLGTYLSSEKTGLGSNKQHGKEAGSALV